ncbi:MAG: Rpn family recombination-promoting nuclease/putative transposase [Bacteroidales bacterium]|nr:Rpn family recombination-promoting nuclease/putative transposase [Bacteroidales bacterium]
MESYKNKEKLLIAFDWAIKRLLKDKGNFEIVEGFISELLGRKVRITDVPENEDDKSPFKNKPNSLDVMVEDEEGEIMLIQLRFLMNIDQLNFQQMVYEVSKGVIEPMKHARGDTILKLRKVCSINILYFDFGQGIDYVYHGRIDFEGMHSKEKIKSQREQKEKYETMENVDLYPEYYLLLMNKFDDVINNTLAEWIYFLKHNKIEEGFSAQGLRKAKEVLDYSRLTPDEKADHDSQQEIKRENYRS